MKILGFEFRKLESGSTKIDVIETWCVKWYSIYHDIGDFWHPRTEIMSFITKEDAECFADELRDAAGLLKNDHQRVKVYKTQHPDNR